MYIRNDVNYLYQQADLYYTGWMKRMKDYGIKVYVSVGDHELGDNWWKTDIKQKFFPHPTTWGSSGNTIMTS